MTLPDALAWADDSLNERWWLARAANPYEPDLGSIFEQMHADALTTLAEAVREREAAEDAKHEADLEQAVRFGCDYGTSRYVAFMRADRNAPAQPAEAVAAWRERRGGGK